MPAKVKVAVFGASGYTGLELLGILARHPGAEIVAATSREHQGRPVSEIFPSLARVIDLAFTPPDPEAIARQVEFVFTAVPHQTAMDLVPRLLAGVLRVVDLSADFRFRDRAVYEAWYQPHSASELLAEAVYGLPELYREQLPQARLVGNPGCYPTCVILGLAPLVKARLVDLKARGNTHSRRGEPRAAGAQYHRARRRRSLQSGARPVRPGIASGHSRRQQQATKSSGQGSFALDTKRNVDEFHRLEPVHGHVIGFFDRAGIARRP